MPALPFKLNQDRRPHIPEQTRKVTNWRDYDESLRRRGSLTVWFSDEAVEAWEAERRTSRGGQPEYSDLAILTGLTLKAVYRLAYRQTEGLIGSVIGLLGLDLAVPDHTTLCRRAETLEVPRPKPRGDGAESGAGRDTDPMHLLVDSTGLKLYGAGEWLVEKHGTKRRRSWRKLVWGVWCQALNIDSVSFPISHPHSQQPGCGSAHDDLRGTCHWAPFIAPQACMRSISADRDHDAAMRIGGEGPKRRVQSAPRPESHAFARRAATSDRHRAPAIAERTRPECCVISSG